MSKIETLVEIASRLPEQKIDELVDYAGYLSTKEDFDGALLSEASLAKSWLSPEDEEAWKDL